MALDKKLTNENNGKKSQLVSITESFNERFFREHIPFEWEHKRDVCNVYGELTDTDMIYAIGQIMLLLDHKYGTTPSNYDHHDQIYQEVIQEALDFAIYLRAGKRRIEIGDGAVYTWNNNEYGREGSLDILRNEPNNLLDRLQIVIFRHPTIKNMILYQVTRFHEGEKSLFDAGAYDVNTRQHYIPVHLLAQRLKR